ncbi:MAG: metal ABC transporter permease [Firmicutes bacterium]|jgi:zinc transport system permease protein|nr:metal ABC transporter permease [Bacillota bacterium]
MEYLYSVLETLLPFSWVKFDFMKNAFLAVLLLTPLFSIIGTMVVENKLAFFSDALGHSALTGIAVGMLLGIAETTLATVLFAIVFAWLLNMIRRTRAVAGDTVISVFSSTAVALGLVLLSSQGNFTKYSTYLIGDILTIRPQEVGMLLAVFIIVIPLYLAGYNRLLAMTVNMSLARTRQIPVRFLESIFIIMIAVAVTVSIKWVGILLVNSLLILPGAAARNLARNMKEYHLWALCFALASGFSGLILSYYYSFATGPAIVLVNAAFFFLTHLVKNKIRR